MPCPNTCKLLSSLRVLNSLCKFIAVLPSLISVIKKIFLEFLHARRRASAQGVQNRLQNKLCPLCKGFCQLICVWQNRFCHSAILPTGSGVLPRTLAFPCFARLLPLLAIPLQEVHAVQAAQVGLFETQTLCLIGRVKVAGRARDGAAAEASVYIMCAATYDLQSVKQQLSIVICSPL